MERWTGEAGRSGAGDRGRRRCSEMHGRTVSVILTYPTIRLRPLIVRALRMDLRRHGEARRVASTWGG